MDSCAFNKLFNKSVPHILEKLFLSLDYGSFKTCLDVNKTWRQLLTSDSYRARGKIEFRNELYKVFCEEEEKLWYAHFCTNS